MNIDRFSLGIRCVFAISIALTSPVFGDSFVPVRVSHDGAWAMVQDDGTAFVGAQKWIQPDVFQLVTLDHVPIAEALRAAPANAEVAPIDSQSVIELPMPDGTFARFQFVESPIMAAELAAKYPEIKTYLGQGIDDPAASVRFDMTPQGFHAQVLSPRGAFYIDPYLKGDTRTYVSYYKRDYSAAGKPFECLFPPEPPAAGARVVPPVAQTTGENLRTYRLACAATGEYTQFHGGTKAAGLSAVVTAINRVSGIYELEVGVRMVLIANNDLLIYTNGATDPYTNNSGFAMLGQNQSNINSVIGSANYDIGHVFSTGGGGVASLGVVCVNSAKARGVTGLSTPIGDAFYVDFVAHEMGHQFRGNHSFNGLNGNCSGGNRNGSTAYEPGSGSTIMAYAGICAADDLQLHSDPFFHGISFDEIRSFITSGSGSICPVVTPTGNNGPSVNAGLNHTIPQSTPFALTPSSSSDPDSDPLTYSWEEFDLGPAAPLTAPDDGAIPLFRSFSAKSRPTRTFPRLEDLLSNTFNDSEKLPTTNRTMNFRVTVRDNRAGGGGVAVDQTQITVHAGSGPFVVTAPTSTIVSGANETIKWAVAGTDQPPVNATNVNILLSLDAGNTFSIVLASATPNDGEEIVAIPAVDTSTAQIKVEADGNVFFALSGICPISVPPTQGPDVMVTNRHLTIRPGNPGRDTLLRVTIATLPSPYDAFNGKVLWVGEPHQVCENSGQSRAVPISECGAAAGVPQKWYWAAPLVCNESDAKIMDWTTLADRCVGGSNDGGVCSGAADCPGGSCGADGLVNVYHSELVPSKLAPGGGAIGVPARYEVQAIDILCSTAVESNFSAPLVAVQPGWGDIVRDCTGCPCTAPDNAVNVVTDVVSLISKFSNLDCAPLKARADLQPKSLDFQVDVLDVVQGLGGFSGSWFPFSPSALCP